MLRRKIRDDADARACLDSAEASGLSRAAWARKETTDPDDRGMFGVRRSFAWSVLKRLFFCEPMIPLAP